MIQYEDFTDEQLIARIRDDSSEDPESMIDYLMTKYKPLVRQKTNAMYLIGGENEDLIQEGMIGLFQAVLDYKEERETSFFHFAEVCINHRLYSALKASNRKKHTPLNTYVSFSAKTQENGISLEELMEDPLSGNPEELVLQWEQREEFRQELLKRLSKMERQVLQLYLEGHSYTEIARIMEKTPKSIDNALQRIRGKIGALKEGR